LVSLKTGIQITGLLAVLLAVFLVVRGGGQFLKDLKNPFSDFKFPELPDFNFFGGDTTISIDPDPTKQTVEQQEEIFGKELTDKEETTINEITKAIGEGDTQKVKDIITSQEGGLSDLFKFNPPGFFGFGVLGPMAKGLPLSLAEALGITSGTTIKDLTQEQLLGIGQFQQTGIIPSEKVTETESEISTNLSPAQQFVQDKLPAGFEGGGPSFIGGSIFETPIANLSLSQIIDKFMVTASQAANIKAIAADNFGDFDFGTNTGGGVGSILPTIQGLQGLGGNVSDNQFEGLSLQEIANKLTGGNISNF